MENQELLSLLKVDEEASKQIDDLIGFGIRIEFDEKDQKIVAMGSPLGNLIEREKKLASLGLDELKDDSTQKKAIHLFLMNTSRAFLRLAPAQDITLKDP